MAAAEVACWRLTLTSAWRIALSGIRPTRLGGVFGQAAIYSDHFHHVAIMRRVRLHMAAWMNDVLPLHERQRPAAWICRQQPRGLATGEC
ncbi:hypothetical protein G3480_24325 [Thiorhodococcus mannitoliphagus]|uniref:Uncharacterized protein n=1 Tax=Thiorhodococcus mannitoliphagus TaxID=329406 RepID=A0A6P1E212_9GAMM|nr:hypothetical protein [Thiorhodococcus mannitoliphagus]NEX23381.1 hypothetical protein [Thiorhodococcus mannitoliphagus]